MSPFADARAESRERGDARADHQALLAVSGLICVLFAVGAAADSAWLYGQVSHDPESQFSSRMLANFLMVAVDLICVVALRPELRRGRWAIGRAHV